MVRFLLFISVLTTTLPLSSQTKCDSMLIKCFDPEEYPIFNKNFPKNSVEKLFEFVFENLKYPETAKVDKIEGKVFVQFVVDTNGLTRDHTIFQSIRQDLDDEALRVTKLIKYDVPAKNNGKPVEYHSALLIRFTLDAEKKSSRNSYNLLDKGNSSCKVKSKNTKNGGR